LRVCGGPEVATLIEISDLIVVLEYTTKNSRTGSPAAQDKNRVLNPSKGETGVRFSKSALDLREKITSKTMDGAFDRHGPQTSTGEERTRKRLSDEKK
jgi:hypothetical protein